MPWRTNLDHGETIPAPDGELGLAYANTRYWRGSAAPTEDLGGPEDLLRWAAGAERLPQRMLVRVAARCATSHGQRSPRSSAARGDFPVLCRDRGGARPGR